MSDAVLEVADLRVSFGRGARRVEVLHGVSLGVRKAERVGIVGESGSGKTLTALACADLLPTTATVSTTTWRFEGHDLAAARRRERASAIGGRMAMVFQDPMSSLNPARRIGAQLIDTSVVHGGLSRRAALDRAAERLASVRISAPRRRLREYPHAFSGGMRQRAVIAMGLMVTPSLLIADEPTTALDVTVQADVMRLIAEINETHGTAVLLVSHNLALISEVCERVVVMYAGSVVEELPVAALQDATHPYTRALLAAVPHLDLDRSTRLTTIPGQLPDPGRPPPGCVFAPRCALAVDRCHAEAPALVTVREGRRAACWVTAAGDPP